VSSATRATDGWRTAEVREVIRETSSASTLVLDVPTWPGHRAGQHVDLRLTAEDGYTAQRSYSLSSAPGDPPAVTVEKIDEGEVSPYLVEVRLLLSARRPEDVLFADELVDPVITYTREAPAGWTGYARRVDRTMLAGAGFEPGPRPRIFVCGPTGLVEGVARELVALGHHASRIRTERFGATGG
jgi:ferredoxin-NADP reductase